MEDTAVTTRKVAVDNVVVGERLRQFSEGQVESLMESIRELGLLTPISVSEERGSGQFTLVAGLHRLEACRRLGWSEIDVLVVDRLDGWERQLWEIDENLMRAELSEGERAEHLLRRKQIFEAMREERRLAGTNSPTKPQHERGFASETAERTGLTKRHINRSIRRAELVAPDVREAIRGTPNFRKGVELDALAELDHADQRRALALVQDGKARTFREAKDRLRPARRSDIDRDRQMKSLLAAWESADEDARRAFLDEVGMVEPARAQAT